MEENRVIDNRYEVIEVLGKGGMAIVYKAKCLVLNRYVAIKVLRPEFRQDEEFIKRFRAEARSAGALSHPNIVSVYDVINDGEIDYIVMEYVEGVTLKQYIEAKGIIPWKEAVDYGAQICSGLEHAHKKGIVHKDIKPHNIMITREGVLKIADFGIAKAINAGTITSGKNTLGSVQYFSPEQARGGYTDAKSDIYSLGVLLYEMVTGRLPFEGENAVSIAMQHIEKKPLSPAMLNPEVPISLENVILKAMCKSPSLRYESAGRMLVDLKKVYIGADIPAVSYDDPAETMVIPKIERPIPEDVNETNNTNGKKQKNKKGDTIGIIAGVGTGILVVILIAFFMFNPLDLGGEKIELPDFTGMTVEEAQETVINSEIEIVVEKEKRDEDAEEGEILSQDPKPGKKVKLDTVVKVIVNAAAEQFDLPDVTGDEEGSAKSELEKLNLNVTVKSEESDTVAKGHVIRQSPEGGNKVSKKSVVTLYVSSGKDESIVKVPNLIGLSLENAKASLLEEGLTWGSIIYVESDKSPNIVLSQEIKPQKEVKEKTSIDLRVSSGPPTSPPTKAPATKAPEEASPTKAPPAQPPSDTNPADNTPTDEPANAGATEE